MKRFSFIQTINQPIAELAPLAERAGTALERLFDPPMWVWCMIAWGLIMVLPIRWRLTSRLLPFAGYYAYGEPSHWRWSERRR